MKKRDGIMDWYDVDDVLYEGRREDISKLKCPDCGGRIQFEYFPLSQNLQVECHNCGYFSRAYGGIIPNCYKFFGEKHVVL